MNQDTHIPLVLTRDDDENISFIPDELRRVVLRILKKGSSSKGLVSTKRLHRAAEGGDPYFVASAVYDFLWKQVASDSRKLLYPVVGDFFLTALEQTLGQIGPNNMSSRFAELMECYKLSGDVHRSLEGPLYCADLFLLKVTQLVLSAGEIANAQTDHAAQPQTLRGSEFLVERKYTVEEQIQHSLELARDALLDCQKELARISDGKSAPNDSYITFVRKSMNRLSLSWEQWNEMHQQKGILSKSPEEYITEGLVRAEKVNSLVLAALLLEQAGEEYQDKTCRMFLNHHFSDKPADHPSRGCIFDAGEIYRDQGITERNHGAYLLSERRFTRAIQLFGQLHDRTSLAQTLIERARVFMYKKAESWRAHDDLHLAAQNIAAVQKRLPPTGPLPELAPEQVLHFLEHKNLLEEAKAYKAHDKTLHD
ncbi:MAG: hypothetical protein KJ060_14175 [Candidatus Hydrogenedentes bacterium]|nr:hypothetical protein [Candidatus Hydrogenedentota bacterium]